MKYSRGQTVVCTWKDNSTQYEAKILDVSAKRKKTLYKVHYLGWKHKWDEWIGEDRIMKVKSKRSRTARSLDLGFTASSGSPSTSKEETVQSGGSSIETREKLRVTSSALGKESVVSPFGRSSGQHADVTRAGKDSSFLNGNAPSFDGSTSSNRNNSRKRKVPTGWIRRSSRTQKLQMQQLGLSEELADDLLNEVDSNLSNLPKTLSSKSNDYLRKSSRILSGAEYSYKSEATDASLENSASKVVLKSEGAKTEEGCSANPVVRKKRNGVKPKNLKLLVSVEHLSKSNDISNSLQQLPSAQTEKLLYSEADESATKQDFGLTSKSENMGLPCSPGTSCYGDTQFVGSVDAENLSSDSHGADMASPTSAIVNIAYELAQSFPGCSEKLSARFLALSPAAAKLNLINDLKSCEKTVHNNKKFYMSEKLHNSENVDGYSNYYKFEENKFDATRRKQRFGIASTSLASEPTLMSSSIHRSIQVDDFEDLYSSSIPSSNFCSKKELSLNDTNQFDVELTEGTELIDLQGDFSKVPNGINNSSHRNGNSKVLSISEFARRIYGARKRMANQRLTDLAPFRTNQRLRLADMFRRNQRGKEETELSDTGMASTNIYNQKRADGSFVPVASDIPRKSQMAQLPVAETAFDDSKQFNTGTSYDSQQLLASHGKDDEMVTLAKSSVGEPKKPRKRLSFGNFIPLPSPILEDHCYIKMPSSFYQDDKDAPCQAEDAEEAEQVMKNLIPKSVNESISSQPPHEPESLTDATSFGNSETNQHPFSENALQKSGS